MKKILLVLLLLLFLSTGCFFRFGERDSANQSVPVGVELRELKKAREEGAISEEEYRLLKQHILEEHDADKGSSEQ